MPMTIGQAVKQRITQLCHERNLSVYRLSTLSGIRQSTVNNIISGRNHSATISTIQKICEGFDITIQEFFQSDLFVDLESETR